MKELILEGGGFRCAFTLGVLRALEEEEFFFDTVRGVSAGSFTGALFVSHQTEIPNDTWEKLLPELKPFMEKEEKVDMEVLLQIFLKHFPYDFGRYQRGNTNFVITATNANTGQMRYFDKQEALDLRTMWRQISASCSLPDAAFPVVINGESYFDGGVREQFPFSQVTGREGKSVVICTFPDRFRRRQKDQMGHTVRGRYPALEPIFDKRADHYNLVKDQIEGWSREGKIFVIAPEKPLPVSVFEANPDAVIASYRQGLDAGKANIEKLREYLDGDSR